MRLLMRQKKDRFVLTGDEQENEKKPYCILSHTWDIDEVRFDELNTSKGKRKRAYQKIKFCADRTAENYLTYFWVDSCCIDRNIQVELSTAINSMYRWYQNAHKCFVFLPDVGPGQHQISPKDWHRTRWFERGWTLQELIAPAKVEFFTSNNEYLGNKKKLMDEIHNVTSIPRHALNGGDLSAYSIEERISWLGNRETTKPEDKVYCLLGILGIALTANYGEGFDNAKRRLLTATREQQIPTRDSDERRSSSRTDSSHLIPFSQNNDSAQKHGNSGYMPIDQQSYNISSSQQSHGYVLPHAGSSSLSLSAPNYGQIISVSTLQVYNGHFPYHSMGQEFPTRNVPLSYQRWEPYIPSQGYSSSSLPGHYHDIVMPNHESIQYHLGGPEPRRRATAAEKMEQWLAELEDRFFNFIHRIFGIDV